MYFGGVAAAMLHPDGSLQAVSDRRRDGAAGVSP
jgi:gamma-glutamyltranspeptidase